MLSPVTARQLADYARGRPTDPRQARELGWWVRNFLRSGPRRGLKQGHDPSRLDEAGWGVVFTHDTDPAVREALGPLLAHRRSQASRHDERYYRELSGALAYQPGESKLDFLARHGVGPGPADPSRMPYYLLLVGDPRTLPFPVQYQLDVQYAVGRLHFDTADEYAAYARTIVDAEARTASNPPRVDFFGIENADDRATRLSTERLIRPLAELLAKDPLEPAVRLVSGEHATKEALTALLATPPALLFSAGHGMGFPSDSPRQLSDQGALLCGDWPGPVAWTKRVPREHYFAAEDVPQAADLQGLLLFLFACYGAGTPEYDDFSFDLERPPKRLAPHPFVARLPQRLLARGAAAVVAHVDRVWGWSFTWPGAGRQLAVFESALGRLLAGDPLGYAMEVFDQRYAELASDLSEQLSAIRFGKQLDELDLAGLWTANRDARNYVVFGDPAVRLAGPSPAPPQATHRLKVRLR